MKFKGFLLSLAAGAVWMGRALMAAEATDEIGELKKQIQALDQKVRVLERNRELEAEAAEAKKSESPRLTIGQNGVSFSSADTNFVLRLGAHLQFDGRFFINDRIGVNDTFLLRRVRPILEGTVFKDYDYRLMLDFGANNSGTSANTGNNAMVQEAYINAHYWEQFQIQVGKFKPPVGLERLQSDVNVRFIERGYPTGLVPNRDVGVQLHGLLFNQTLAYQAGVFNGVQDGGSGDIDIGDDHKDLAGRLFAQPFKNTHFEPVRGLGLGVAGTYGNQGGALPKFVTPGQQTFFTYLTGSGNTFTNVVAGGTHWRLVPQGSYYWGPLGVFGEYAISSQKVRRDARTAGGSASTIGSFRNEAWEVSGTYLLTGEENSFYGVTPRAPLNFANGTWGAWELAGRVGQFTVDDGLFPLYALSGSASKATSWGVGVNWYLNKNVKLSLDYEQTYFKDGSSQPGNVTAQDERIIFTRAQLAF